MATIECTPAGVKELTPCLQCMSESELRMGLLLEWMTFGRYTLAEVLENSKCFTCLSETEMLRAKVALFGNLIFHDLDLSELIEANECIRCLKPGQVEAAILWLICDFIKTFSDLAD